MQVFFRKKVVSMLVLTLVFFYVLAIQLKAAECILSDSADIMYYDNGDANGICVYTEAQILVGSDCSPNVYFGAQWARAALEFNFSGITDTITSAILDLNVTEASASGTKLYLYATTSTIDENLGGSYLPSNIVEGAYVGESATRITAPGTVSIDITTFVNAEVAKGNTNIKLVVKGDESTSANNYIVMSGDEDTANAPQIRYETTPTVHNGNFAFDAATSSVTEGTSTANLTVTRTGGTDGVVTVGYRVKSGGSAISGSDYVLSDGTVTFADGSATSQNIQLDIVDDNNHENDETLQVELYNPSAGSLGATSTCTLTIHDNDIAQSGNLGFSTVTSNVTEGTSTANLTVIRSGGSDEQVTVHYSIAGGTATTGSDYNLNSGTLTFENGQTEKNIPVTIVNDSIYEADETVIVSLDTPGGGATLQGITTHTLTILENDKEAGEFAFESSTKSVSEDVGSFTVKVNRGTHQDGTASVDYAVTGGTASEGTDYTLAYGTLNFANGETYKNISIQTIDNLTYNEDKTIELTLSNAQGGATLTDPKTITITLADNDRKPGTLSFKDPISQVAENVGTHTASLTVERIGGTDGTVTADYELIAGGTATSGVDYVLTSGNLTFVSGISEQTIPVTILDNASYNQDKTVKLHLYNVGGGGSLGTSEATLTIVNDDPAQYGSLNFEHSTSQVAENDGSISLKVLRTGGTDGAVSVDYSVTGGSASSINDYTLTAGTLNFAEGESEKSITVTIKNNNVYNTDKTIELTLDHVQGGASIGGTGSTTLTIQNDDSKQYGTLQFAQSDVQVAENASSADLVVTRTGGTDDEVTVGYNVVDGTAINDPHYSLISRTLTFPSGSDTSQMIHIPIIDNATYNGNQTLILELSDPQGGASLGTPKRSTLTIVDDESPKPGKLAFESSNIEIDEATTTADLKVVRTDGTNGTVSAHYKILGESTATNNTDYTLAEGTVTFGEGVDSQIIPIAIQDDTNYEADETVVVNLDSVTGATLGTITTATLTIKDNDQKAGELAFSESSGIVDETTSKANLAVTRTNGTDGMVSVDYAVTGGSAVNGTDYVLNSGTLTFGNTEATKEIPIDILDNTVYGEDKTVQVTLSNPTGGATLGSQKVYTLTIHNDEPKREGQLQFENSAVQIAENAGAVDLNVTRTGGTDGDVSVQYAVTSSTALNNEDYILTSGTLTFLDGGSSQTIHIPILDNAIYNGNKTIEITLSNPTGGASLGSNTMSTLTIADDESPKPGKLAFDKASLEVIEGATTANLKVVRTDGTNGTVSAHYKILGESTATNGIDYTLAEGTVTFGEGVDSQIIPIVIQDDASYETEETVIVNLDNVTGATLGTITTATLTIKDNDQMGGVIGFSQDRSEVKENTSTAHLNVARVGGTDGSVSVDYAVTGGSAVNGTDYTLASGTLTFENGVAAQDLMVNIINNTTYSGDKTIQITLSHPTGGATLGTQVIHTLTLKDDETAPQSSGGGGTGSSSGGGGTTTSQTAPGNVPVIVNGKTENIGQKQVEQGVTTITVNQEVLEQKIDKAENQSTVIVPITSNTDKVLVSLEGKNIQNMIDKDMLLEVKTDNISYILPASEIPLDVLGEKMNSNDLKVEVAIVKSDETVQKTIQEAGSQAGFQMIGTPIEFTVYVSAGGERQEISKFESYVPREVGISAEEANRITTAIVYNPDGTMQHRPTFVYKQGDKYYAKINSLTNSVYTLIENHASFKDTKGKWYEEVVTEMASRKIINGVSEGLYQGERCMTRAEFAAIMVNALGLKTEKAASFEDVSATAWYAEFVATASEYGIIEGVGENKFNPNANITREEAMVMLQRAGSLVKFPERLNARDVQKEFNDLNRISAWANDAVVWNLNNHLVTGADGEIRPKDYITRAEVATIVLRFLQQANLIDVRSKA